MSRIRANGNLSALLERFQTDISLITSNTFSVPVSAFEADPGFEVIRLKDQNKELMDYEETDETLGMRARLSEWNSFAAGHWSDIFLPDEEFAALLRRPVDADEEEEAAAAGEERGPVLDLTKRFLYRVFNNGSFDEGGRLYGAWWQWLPSDYRKFITINGSPTAEVDYSNMHTVMLYANVGQQPPEDAYTLPGVDPAYRKIIKKTFFQMINAGEGQRMRPPKAGELPDGMNFNQLQAAIMERHEPIAQYLRSGMGIQLQKIDAEIALDVMRWAQSEGLLLLPVHDSFVVRAGLSPWLKMNMMRCYEARLGQQIGTKTKPAAWDEDHRRPKIIETEVDLRKYNSPEFAGYRSRLQAFFARMPEEWRQKNFAHPLAPNE